MPGCMLVTNLQDVACGVHYLVLCRQQLSSQCTTSSQQVQMTYVSTFPDTDAVLAALTQLGWSCMSTQQKESSSSAPLPQLDDYSNYTTKIYRINLNENDFTIISRQNALRYICKALAPSRIHIYAFTSTGALGEKSPENQIKMMEMLVDVVCREHQLTDLTPVLNPIYGLLCRSASQVDTRVLTTSHPLGLGHNHQVVIKLTRKLLIHV